MVLRQKRVEFSLQVGNKLLSGGVLLVVTERRRFSIQAAKRHFLQRVSWLCHTWYGLNPLLLHIERSQLSLFKNVASIPSLHLVW